MRKVEFIKTINRDGKRDYIKAKGYRETYSYTNNFDDVEIPLIFEHLEYDWSITDEESGLLLCRDFLSKNEAIAAVTDNFLLCIYDRKERNKKLIEKIKKERMEKFGKEQTQ